MNSELGGFVGGADRTGSGYKFVLTNSYNAGEIIRISPHNNDKIGALIGHHTPTAITVTASYYLSGTALSGSGANSNFDNLAKTNQELTSLSTFNSSWDITCYSNFNNDDSVWVIDDKDNQATYPWLRWMEEPTLAQVFSSSTGLVASDCLVVSLDAADPSSFASYTIGNGVTVTSITNTSVFNFDSSNNTKNANIDLGQPLESGNSFTFEAWVYDNGIGTSRNIISSQSTVFFFKQQHFMVALQ